MDKETVLDFVSRYHQITLEKEELIGYVLPLVRKSLVILHGEGIFVSPDRLSFNDDGVHVSGPLPYSFLLGYDLCVHWKDIFNEEWVMDLDNKYLRTIELLSQIERERDKERTRLKGLTPPDASGEE